MEKQYTNAITHELIAQMKAHYSAAAITDMDEDQDWRAVFGEHLKEMTPELWTLSGVLPRTALFVVGGADSEPLPDDFLVSVPEGE